MIIFFYAIVSLHKNSSPKIIEFVIFHFMISVDYVVGDPLVELEIKKMF